VHRPCRLLASSPCLPAHLPRPASSTHVLQIVGRTVSVARELLESQKELPFLVSPACQPACMPAALGCWSCWGCPLAMAGLQSPRKCSSKVVHPLPPCMPACLQITGGMFAELKRSAAAELVHLGSVQLTSCPGEEEAVYTLERYGRMQLSQPAAAAAETAAAEAEAASSDSQEDADALTPTAVAAAAHPGSSREVSAARTAPASPEPAPPLPSATPHSSSSSDGSIGSAHAATTTTGSSPLPGKRQQQAAAAGGKGAAASSPGHPLPAAEQPPAAAPLVASLTTKG
jgi:hypothetical protein